MMKAGKKGSYGKSGMGGKKAVKKTTAAMPKKKKR